MPRPQAPTSWRTFWLGLVTFFVGSIVVVAFFQSDTAQARAERKAWLQSCGGGVECAETAEEWHDLCFYMRAGGESHFDKLPQKRRHRWRREYDPNEYRSCMDGHARDYLTGLKVDDMLRRKEEAARSREREARGLADSQ